LKSASVESAPHYHFASIDSTNNYASKIAKLPETSNGTAISADFQSEGRGQRGTTWESASQQGYLVSIILYPKLQASEVFYFSKFIAVCLLHTLNQLGLEKVQIKWPNDIYVNSKKLAGILIENTWSDQELQFGIAGIGLNIQTPSNTEFKSTGLLDHLSMVPTLNEYVKAFQRTIQEHWHWIEQKKFNEIDQHYHRQLFQLQLTCAFIAANGESFEGRIQRVESDGALIILDEQDKQRAFYLKEIKFA
jgi:BirA family transcriptional regulator, biotin operon repressor / biotin---[acetyl-CoA-carboxylase] ligase